jgi:hypothetical protein
MGYVSALENVTVRVGYWTREPEHLARKTTTRVQRNNWNFPFDLSRTRAARYPLITVLYISGLDVNANANATVPWGQPPDNQNMKRSGLTSPISRLRTKLPSSPYRGTVTHGFNCQVSVLRCCTSWQPRPCY